jgi:hypothetical protein
VKKAAANCRLVSAAHSLTLIRWICVVVSMQHEQLPGQAVLLLRVAAEESADAGVRHMAAINFKNFVKRSWEKSDHEASQGKCSGSFCLGFGFYSLGCAPLGAP